MKHLIALPCLLAALAARAHDGHGLPGASHWHASDSAGFAVVIALALAAVWLGRSR